MISDQQLHNIIDAISNVKVLVIGDIMLDMYEHCVVKRISPEAPVPVATVVSDSWFLGGAGNVASNARALGATVSLVGVLGEDREGSMVQNLLLQNDINHDGIIKELGRVTTLKKRVVSGTQQLLRIDREDASDITVEAGVAVCKILGEKIPLHDVVIISDYCKGLLTDFVVNFIKEEALQHGKKIFVDSKNRNLVRYSGVHVIKPNKLEAEVFAGEVFAHDYVNLSDIGKRVSNALSANLIVTLGGDGIALFSADQVLHMKTEALQVFDVSGAGDTVLSVIATAVAAGADLEEAVRLSNLAAGHVVSRLGTTVCDNETLKQILFEQGNR